ncbi:MAG: lipoyl synthase [Aquificae bacterium]|nr:lipoyl synthase [Aquificota bacterium]
MKPTVRLSELTRMKKLLRKAKLRTVCEESRCPNISDCFSRSTATFLILGKSCTRRCSFCNVSKSLPALPDPSEPYRLLKAVKALNLSFVVVTSPTRDDLPDGGASQFARCVELLKRHGVKTEVLVPDFKGCPRALETVLAAGPAVFAHNLETVPRLYPRVRKGADFNRSLELLRRAKQLSPDTPVKSALILGFGEKKEEVLGVMERLRKAGVDGLVIGQYYPPSLKHHRLVKLYTEEEFRFFEEKGKEMGFRFVVARPNARSSYRAAELIR